MGAQPSHLSWSFSHNAKDGAEEKAATEGTLGGQPGDAVQAVMSASPGLGCDAFVAWHLCAVSPPSLPPRFSFLDQPI